MVTFLLVKHWQSIESSMTLKLVLWYSCQLDLDENEKMIHSIFCVIHQDSEDYELYSKYAVTLTFSKYSEKKFLHYSTLYRRHKPFLDWKNILRWQGTLWFVLLIINSRQSLTNPWRANLNMSFWRTSLRLHYYVILASSTYWLI